MGTATTSGNVGIVAGHIILPQITGLHTMILTLLFMSPMLYYLFHNPHPKLFVHAVRSILSCTCWSVTYAQRSFLTAKLFYYTQFVFAQMTSFMCGYHVHEKAILYAILPMTLLSCDSRGDARVYMLLSWVGHFSLLPLLFEIREQPLQLFAYLLHSIASYITLDTYMQNEERKMRIKETGVVFKWYQLMYLYGFIPLYIFTHIIHPFYFVNRMEFLPLLLISIYCSIGMVHVWYLIYFQFKRRLRLITQYSV